MSIYVGGHLVVHFNDKAVLMTCSISGEPGVSIGGNTQINSKRIENWSGAFMMLKPSCYVSILEKEMVVSWSGYNARIPLDLLIEVYVKENGRRIWPIP